MSRRWGVFSIYSVVLEELVESSLALLLGGEGGGVGGEGTEEGGANTAVESLNTGLTHDGGEGGGHGGWWRRGRRRGWRSWHHGRPEHGS